MSHRGIRLFYIAKRCKSVSQKKKIIFMEKLVFTIFSSRHSWMKAYLQDASGGIKSEWFSAFVRPDPVDSVRDDHDGGDRRYGSTARRRRYRLAFSDLPHITVKFVLHSGLFTSARILVYRARHHIPIVHPVHVLAPHTVLHHQS